MTITKVDNAVVEYYVAIYGDFMAMGMTHYKAIENLTRQLAQIYA